MAPPRRCGMDQMKNKNDDTTAAPELISADRPVINKWRHYSDGYTNEGFKGDDDIMMMRNVV
jgi:hypothetical protein